jgi:serine/threonine protein kinase
MANPMTPCSSCGLPNESGTTRCQGCGRPLATVPTPVSTPVVNSSSTGSLAPATLLHGRYLILGLAGTGGMGVVYRAADRHLGERIVAVKEMHQHGLTPQEILSATHIFQQEARLLASLHHPSLPNIHDHFNSGGRWYLVMDYVEGMTLQQRLGLYGSPGLHVGEVLRLADQICAVLDFLHGQVPPVIFRDLKPSNIMVTPNNQLCLIDFGIARIFKPGQAFDTIALGSAGYAAPEQYGRSQTTVRSDIYSLGATLHNLLTGLDPALKPFAFPPVRPWSPETPAELEALILSMVQLDENNRPASIAQVRQSLAGIIERMGITRPTRLAEPSPYRLPAARSIVSVATPASPVPGRLPTTGQRTESRRRVQGRSSRVIALLGGAVAMLCAAALICSAASGALASLSHSSATAAAESTLTARQQTLVTDERSLVEGVTRLAQDSQFSAMLSTYARDWKRMQNDYVQEQTDYQKGCAVPGNAYQVETVDINKIATDSRLIDADDASLSAISSRTSQDIQQVQSIIRLLQSDISSLEKSTGEKSSTPATQMIANATSNLSAAGLQVSASRKAMQSAQAAAATYDQRAAQVSVDAAATASSLHC